MPAPDLDAFPRPGVTVDLALLTVTSAEHTPVLRLLVQDRADPAGRALPGGFIRERRTIAQTVDDVLRRKVGIALPAGSRPRLLRVFDDPTRDDRTWAISVAHSLSLHEDDVTGVRGDLVPVARDGRLEGEGGMLFDHDAIVTEAVGRLRERYEFRFRYRHALPDPDGFLTEPFTLHQLRKVHEAVLGTELHKDNFNQRMKVHLSPLQRNGKPVLSTNLRGRPATLYTRHPDGRDDLGHTAFP